jgi:hypothetical protein
MKRFIELFGDLSVEDLTRHSDHNLPDWARNKKRCDSRLPHRARLLPTLPPIPLPLICAADLLGPRKMGHSR